MNDRDIESDPRIAMEAKKLHELLVMYAGRYLLSEHTFGNIEALLGDHQKDCKKRGIDFPDLVPLVIPRVQAIEVVRRDIEPEGLQTTILNLTVKYPAIKPDDIARALYKAFPKFKKTNFMIHHSERRHAQLEN